MAAIQVLSQANPIAQRIITVSASEEPLPADSVRIKTRLISLTNNNIGGARLGVLRVPGLTLWDVWPMPAEAGDGDCRISAWGFSEVIASTIPDLQPGTHLLGYQPLGTASEVLQLREAGVSGHWLETSPRRAGLLGIYNRYFRVEWDTSEEAEASKAWDALMKFLFESSYSLNRFVFDETGKTVTHPLGFGEWAVEKASLAGAVVVMLGASGKTGIAFAHQLRQRGEAERPGKMVAVGSAGSRDFTINTGLFDAVLDYKDVDKPIEGVTSARKVVLVDFGARGGVADGWAAALRKNSASFQGILVGADPQAGLRSGEMAALAQDPSSDVARMNAGGLRETGIEKLGEKEFFRETDAAWDKFKADGGVPGLKFVWLKGIEGVEKAWDALAKGEYGPDTGVLVELD